VTTVFSATIGWCWIIFLVYWIVNARGVKPVAQRLSGASRAAYRIPIIAGAILLWGPIWREEWARNLTPLTYYAHAIGAVLCVFGLGIAVWARRTLAGNWSSDVTFKQGHELIEGGPYRFVRHPIYTGLILMVIGMATAKGTAQAWLGVFFQCIGFWIKLRQEETVMLQHFPNEYPSYMKRVKALVPFVI
jgi:protein-S-isoprenylcysteine O-methyltransferase Ste14